MAGQQSPRRTSLNLDDDTDEDKEEISKVQDKLSAKLQVEEVKKSSV